MSRAGRVTGVRAWWSRVRGPVDPLLFAATARGEITVARVRLWMTATLLLIPLGSWLEPPHHWENLVGLGAAAAALLLSIGLFVLVTRGLYRHWLSLVTSAMDVSLVSATLAMFLLFDAPHTTVNSKVVYECYFLAIGASALRYDVRICLFAGLLAVVQYAAVVVAAATGWSLNDPRYAPFAYGTFSWATQISRLVLLGAFSALVAVVVKRSWELRYLSATDRLTGLYNRNLFNEHFAAEIARAHRYHRPFTIVMIDVDRFKILNDTFGHAAGDAALQSVASMLRRSFRLGDVVSRYGGEEFVVLMPETRKAQAMEKLEAVRHAIESTPCILPAGAGQVTLTISIGLASFPEDGAVEHELLSRADGRLLAAKARGRNRVVAG